MDSNTLHGQDVNTRIDQLMNVNAKFHGTMVSFGIASLITTLAHEKHLQNEESVRRGNAGMGALEITQTEVRNAEQVKRGLLDQIRNDLTAAFDEDGILKNDWKTIDSKTPIGQLQPEYAGVGPVTTGTANLGTGTSSPR